jgi:hypothetical protein
MKVRSTSLLLLIAFCLLITCGADRLHAQKTPSVAPRRVLLVSIDGFRALDLANFVRSHPNSALAQLSSSGVTYSQAFTTKPSDFVPGELSLLTGGSPISTGVWYEATYSRTLSPPGSNCKTLGTQVGWGADVNKVRDALDAGGGIDPAKLPLDPRKGCSPVYPHDFLRVNTIFEIAHAAGMRTAWIERHPTFEMVSGPSGKGLDDLFTPEIKAITKDVKGLEGFDDLKVEAVLNQIAGKDHAGKNSVGVPAVFGMTFQSVSFGQMLATGGYTDASGTPSKSLLELMEHTDQSIGKMVSALKSWGLLDSTVIIITASSGQAPMDRSKARIIDDTIIPNLVNRVQSGLVAYVNGDGDVMSLWLTDQSQTAKVAEILNQPSNQSAAGIQKVLWGESLRLMTNDPIQDTRIPDLVIIPDLGVSYQQGINIAAHGGFSEDDTHVALLLSRPGLAARTIKTPVQTTQVAPTILQVLGIDPELLQAVRQERTAVLPGLFAGSKSSMGLLSSE